MRRLSLVSLLLGLSAFLAACPSGEAPVGLILDAGEERADSGRDGDAPEPRDDAAEPWRDMVLPREDVPEIPRVDLPQEFLEQEMTWTPCVLHDRDGSGTAECADLVVPFYWDDLESETFTVHAKRLVREGSTRQLFMLQGGPGSPGTATLSLAMERVFDADPEMDVYAIDHRGTGKSHELTCPVQEAPDSLGGEEIIGDEWEACALHLETEALDAFTVSAAARDVALLIALAGEAGKAPLVYGVSYGTFWAHRYAVLFPEQPDAVVLDSLIPPGGYQVDIKDQEENEVTHVLFDLCAGDDLCASKLGEDPWGYANEVFQAYSAGQACDKLLAKGIYPETLQGFINGLGTMLWLGRAMIPAIFYRMDRCTGQDAVAVYNAIAWYYGLDGAYWREELSDALGRHLMLSELVFEPEGGAMTPDEILAYEAGLLSTRYLSYYNTIHLAFWPTYALDEAWGEWAPPAVPVLVLQGDLDYMTPLANVADAAEHLTGPRQHVVTLPRVRHAAMFESPVDDGFENHCGFEIAMAWLRDPASAPDTSCVDDILPVDFQGDSELVAASMKTSDLWENADFNVGCDLPGDFLVPFADDHASLQVVGEIGDVDGELSLSNAVIDVSVNGASLPFGDGTVYVYDYFSYGNHYVLVQAVGSLDYYSAYHYRYDFLRITFPTIMLTNVKSSGGYLLPLAGEMGYASLTISDIETKEFGVYGTEDYAVYYRMCPLAVADPDAALSSFWVCHDDNSAFTVGESLRLAGNIALSTDPEILQETFQMTGACSCWRDQGIPFPCTDFDEL